jgi:hypothetical protein
MFSSAEMERMMKVQEVILKAMAGSLKWWDAAEIIGVTDRGHFQEKLVEEHGLQISYTWVKAALQGAGLVSKQ